MRTNNIAVKRNMREGNVAWKQEGKEAKNNDDMSFYLCIRSLIETFVTRRCVAACALKLCVRASSNSAVAEKRDFK